MEGVLGRRRALPSPPLGGTGPGGGTEGDRRHRAVSHLDRYGVPRVE